MMAAYNLPRMVRDEEKYMETVIPPLAPPFAARASMNQDFFVNRNEPQSVEPLEEVPNAAPCMSVAEIFDLRGFRSPELWKFAMLECVVTTSPQTDAGVYSTATFFTPLFIAITIIFITPLLLYTFTPSSGGHINPTITLAMFFARTISFPRMVLYVGGQTVGGALAGFAMSNAYRNRETAVGGCHIDTSLVAPGDALIIELFSCLLLIFVAFAVALDPRRAKGFGTSAPWFVGIILGVVSWATAFTREGYSGAGLNPARCFGVYVASSFPGYHWVHWVGPLLAAAGHGIFYLADPLWFERSSP
ncbi:unnamed protein product [Penicillium salamii]|uniref:Aquaporin-like protein n=1 Tax=Penicillium salamii TaxID=1612424 RepID=A0A9W4N3N4_9EURO|nr:unnamed protein product [Penicillium salamii]CAG7991343.1 unnamed protein product [Penicillium salamii]CAG7997940.1 unnamed protein product [Penicillium salamii]CAG8075909.1 unnamed protein product [Penicillium salamii]CAG8252708.1 unnamed protein product [Penicillium salamii]